MAEERNEDGVIIPDRAHDQPAEGGRQQTGTAGQESEQGGATSAGTADPEAAGIVDQQGAALRQMNDQD